MQVTTFFEYETPFSTEVHNTKICR